MSDSGELNNTHHADERCFEAQLAERQRAILWRIIAAWQAEKAFIAALMAQGPVAAGRTWKREDLYDRGSTSVGGESSVSCSQHTTTVS